MTPNELEHPKREAEKLHKATGATHTACLEELAKKAGYPSYRAAQRTAQETKP